MKVKLELDASISSCRSSESRELLTHVVMPLRVSVAVLSSSSAVYSVQLTSPPYQGKSGCFTITLSPFLYKIVRLPFASYHSPINASIPPSNIGSTSGSDISDDSTVDDVDDVDEDIIKEYEERFLAYINDDMNMPGAMSVVWEIARNAKKSIKFADLLLKFDKVLGLDMKNAENYLLEFKHEESEELPEEIKALVEERKQARAEKNWAKSDEIRDRIISLGYSIKDTKDGIIVKKEN